MATAEKQNYEFTEDGWFLGTFYKAGERARFHAAQVKFDLHRMKLVEVPAKAAAKPKSAE